MVSNNIKLNNNERVKFLINVVKEKLVAENIKFAKVLVSNWDEIIDDEMLSKLSLSKDDLKSEVEIDDILKEITDEYIAENLEDAERLISRMNQFAGDGSSSVAVTAGRALILISVLIGSNIEYTYEDGKHSFGFKYEQSQESINKLLEIIDDVKSKIVR